MEKIQEHRIETENNEESEELRIGYYCCEWGVNIRSKIDCDKLVEYVKDLSDEIIISKKNPFLWTDTAQNEILEDIKEKGFTWRSCGRRKIPIWSRRWPEEITLSATKKRSPDTWFILDWKRKDRC